MPKIPRDISGRKLAKLLEIKTRWKNSIEYQVYSIEYISTPPVGQASRLSILLFQIVFIFKYVL